MFTYKAFVVSNILQKNFVRHGHTKLNEVFIISAVRTPVGSFLGSFSTQPATFLGSVAIKEAIKRAGLSPPDISEVYMGQVAQAGCKQNPARQAVLAAGCPETTEATTINKVCSSGLKSVMLAAQGIMAGHRDIMVAGGMESMSCVPYYLFRGQTPYGGITLHDGIVHDGLTDAYKPIHMGVCAENLAKNMNISRDEQDKYAIQSYSRSRKSAEEGIFKKEICPVSWKNKKGKETIVDKDEEFIKFDEKKLLSLKPAFIKDGTVTAGNSSTLNDGGGALVLASQEAVDKHKLSPIARIICFADAATHPIDFTIAPSFAIPRLLEMAGISKDQVDLWELNEAFSIVAIANVKKLQLDPSKVNVHGGAVSIGHPIGMSGARILIHLVHALGKGQKGAAAICNGGGAASSILIEKF